ncbi:MAG: molybdopterin molybdotransferase MoeA [Alphaproteobacteria bacterium]|nr:molybdopterin molybdotransferase MoeA [Alphaproteobacteria bacterium]
MISVEEARQRVLAGVAPLSAEQVAVSQALGRVLAEDIVARVTQPPIAVSAMDGYAVRAADVAAVPAVLAVVGHVPAGGAFDRRLGPGEAVRIFTGAPVPEGADAIVIQEDTEAAGSKVTVKEAARSGRYVRPAGLDFRAGDVGIRAGRRLTARDIGLAAAMNVPWLKVHRRPRVAILATGDEVVMPGTSIGRSQIVCSNGLSLAAAVAAVGGEPIDLGIAADNREALTAMAAGARGADMLVTTGGASVGEHDLIREVLGEAGLAIDFWQIAMRPGKPLIFGRIHGVPMLGLPGNPVSTLVCSTIFLVPALEKMQGLTPSRGPARTAALARALDANDGRQDYLRATLTNGPDGSLLATPFDKQDSSMLATLAHADCLVVRPPRAPAAKAGDRVEIVPFPAGPSGI